jgi:hypothetical protein
MKSVFHEAFGRWPNSREILVINRLIRLYGEDITEDAIKLSIVVTNGSPVNYMTKVANELSKKLDVDYSYIERVGKEQLEELNESSS